MSPRPDPSPRAAVELPGFRSPLDPDRALRVGGRTHYPREHVSEVQQSRIMDAFVQVVAEEGYENAGIKVICRRAGVAFNTFYEYYQTKEELFLKVYDIGARTMLQRAGDAFHVGAGTLRDRVDGVVGFFLEMLADNPAFARFSIVEIHKVGDEAMRRVDAVFASALAVFGDAAAYPRVPMALDDLLPLVIGGIYARIASYIRAGRTAELPELAGPIMAFILATLGDQTAEDEPA